MQTCILPESSNSCSLSYVLHPKCDGQNGPRGEAGMQEAGALNAWVSRQDMDCNPGSMMYAAETNPGLRPALLFPASLQIDS